MTADEGPESVPRSHAAEDVDASQEASLPDAAASSAAPTFAFAAWKAELELVLQRERDSVHESVQALQSDFDDRSQFVRGDFAWRKQVTAFHDRLQDVLTTQLSGFASIVSAHAAQVADSLAQTLAKVERDGQRVVHQQEQKGEFALRRARAALAKEVERIARLEKCLRLEEARQAAATLAERERQLIAKHSGREAHLLALLGDMRSSNESLETLNSQLLEALRTSRTELDQLRNTLVRSMSRPKRRNSSLLQGDNKNAGAESTARGSGDKNAKNSTSLESLPSTANELLLVPTLRQSLSTAAQTVANLKNRVNELESARSSDKQKLRELQLTLAQAENEKIKATKLLSEARSALIDNENKLAQASDENVLWQGKFDTLQALAQGRERALADSQRLEEVSQEQLAVLKNRVQRAVAFETRLHGFERAVDKWRDNQGHQGEIGNTESSAPEKGNDDSWSLEDIVTSFLSQEECEETENVSSLETPSELEVRLRYKFEKRFSEQLVLRISHERQRVLERLERICATEAITKQDRSQRTREDIPRASNLESDFTRLKRLIKAAYNQLGVCVGAWSETDLDGLHARLETLTSQIQDLEDKLESAVNRAESQRVSLVRAELANQEKDLLLAEITSRYRQLHAIQTAWGTQQQRQEQQSLRQRQPIEHKPLTVYGIPQPMVQKPKLHTLMQLPARTRPASAAPCLESVDQYEIYHRVSQPPPSRLDSCAATKTWNSDHQQQHKRQMEKVEEHIRSVLKKDLMRHEIENQFEDTVGSDGVSYLTTYKLIAFVH
ncbi:unnamed protein product [Phytophthora lilii]|uniref:Unnamed protein product n=1 Tax=Phytophthora lilii TaxID=2077276 RepID=A0A9W7D7T3_9STRA|nr:unnamed protein product [Phytophthora lilii]